VQANSGACEGMTDRFLQLAVVTAAAAHPTAGVTEQMLMMLSEIFSAYPAQGLNMRCSVSSKTPPLLLGCL